MYWGNYDPHTHYFNPMENPPAGWVRGPDGLFTKLNLSASTSNPPRFESNQSQGPSSTTNTITGMGPGSGAFRIIGHTCRYYCKSCCVQYCAASMPTP